MSACTWIDIETSAACRPKTYSKHDGFRSNHTFADAMGQSQCRHKLTQVREENSLSESMFCGDLDSESGLSPEDFSLDSFES